MYGTIGEAILESVVPTAVLGVTAAGHGAVVADIGKGIAAASWIVKKHRIGAERALPAEGQRAEMRGRNTGVDFVVERLAGTCAVDSVGIACAGKAVVDDVRLGCVSEQAGLRIDAGGRIKNDVPAMKELFLATDAETGLLQVVGRDEEAVLIAIAIDQRCALIVVAILRQAVADPADADVIGTVERDTVPGQCAVGEGKFASAGAG